MDSTRALVTGDRPEQLYAHSVGADANHAGLNLESERRVRTD